MPTHTATEKAVMLLPAASVTAPSSKNKYVFLLTLVTVELDFRVFKSSGARAISILIPLHREVGVPSVRDNFIAAEGIVGT